MRDFWDGDCDGFFGEVTDCRKKWQLQLSRRFKNAYVRQAELADVLRFDFMQEEKRTLKNIPFLF